MGYCDRALDLTLDATGWVLGRYPELDAILAEIFVWVRFDMVASPVVNVLVSCSLICNSSLKIHFLNLYN